MKNRILTACFIGMSLPVMAQQPANTYNVKTQGGAMGNGTANDTAAIQNTLKAANAAGKGVYFPAGTYIVNAISIPDNTSIFGDKAGISLMKSVQPYKNVNMGDDDDDVGETIGNLKIEDLFFLNMRFSFQNNAMSKLTMSRCVIATDKIAPDGQGWMMYELDGDDMAVEDCIFLSGHETGEWLGGRIKAIKANKTKGTHILRNIIGLDMGNLSWLATEWQGYASWPMPWGVLTNSKPSKTSPAAWERWREALRSLMGRRM
jgi:Pectate lyase superfamily protein